MTAVRRPTMPDVARHAGVSLKTVSRVVNDEPNVAPETAERVLRAVAELGFRRNEIARSLRAGRPTPTVGLVIEDLSNPFYGTVARAVEEVARRHGAMVIAASSEEDAARERELVTALLQRRVDGLLVVPASDDHRYLQPELSMGTPVVFLDRPAHRIRTDVVELDNHGGGVQAAEHLLRLGHRRVAVLGPDASIPTIRRRLDGFRTAMAGAGVTVDEDLLALSCVDPAGATAAARDLLARRRPPTAFFALNNRMTIGLVRAVRAAAADVGVVGFDDFELADLLPVPVSVVAGDVAEMGRRAAGLLFERLAAGATTSRTRRIVVPTTLTARDASAMIT